jgi:hypothetical protein
MKILVYQPWYTELTLSGTGDLYLTSGCQHLPVLMEVIKMSQMEQDLKVIVDCLKCKLL